MPMRILIQIAVMLVLTAIAFAALAAFMPVNDRPYFHGGRWQSVPLTPSR